jgi:hypothetical protein
MCEEWIKKNKVILGLVLLIIVFVFLYKKSENFDEKDLKFDASKLRKLRGQPYEFKNYWFSNTKVSDTLIDNALIKNAKLNNVKLQTSIFEDAELTGNTMMKDATIDGTLRAGNDVLKVQNKSLLINADENSSIAIGGQTLRADTIKFINELKNKSEITQ